MHVVKNNDTQEQGHCCMPFLATSHRTIEPNPAN